MLMKQISYQLKEVSMVTTVSQTPNKLRAENENPSTLKRQSMATQIRTEQVVEYQPEAKESLISAQTTVEPTGKWASLFSRVTGVFWRASLGFEPVVQGFLPPSTIEFRRSNILSSKEKAELKVYLMKR
jgi:hypothetical protein